MQNVYSFEQLSYFSECIVLLENCLFLSLCTPVNKFLTCRFKCRYLVVILFIELVKYLWILIQRWLLKSFYRVFHDYSQLLSIKLWWNSFRRTTNLWAVSVTDFGFMSHWITMFSPNVVSEGNLRNGSLQAFTSWSASMFFTPWTLEMLLSSGSSGRLRGSRLLLDSGL